MHTIATCLGGNRVAGLNYINLVNKKSSNRIYETMLYYKGGEWKKDEENEKERYVQDIVLQLMALINDA